MIPLMFVFMKIMKNRLVPMNILRFWITLVFICFALNSGIQHANAKLPPKMIDFENFTTKDGLSNPVVYDIVQDRNDFLWFATGNGLSKFDGYGLMHVCSTNG